MLDEGADILDVGGESTRPNATPIAAEQEQERVLPVIEAILAERPNTILSIDTYHAATARCAIAAGAEIVNDVSGLTWDDEMAATCTELRCGVIVMHARGKPQEWRTLPSLPAVEVTPLVLRELGQRVQSALHAGIERERIVIDPGVGFGKRGEENYPLLARIEDLRELGLPVMVGVSRKGFLGEAIASLHGGVVPGVEARVSATTAANVAAVLSGAHLLRVHDVLAAAEAAAVTDKILAEV
jgi:dihydropteroate synthase